MKRKGFTLIELLVVIAIIGILATIGLVALNGAREKARDATRKSDISQIKTALTLYSDDNQNLYPSTSGTSCDSGSGASCVPTAGSIFAAGTNPIVTTYLSRALQDPTPNATATPNPLRYSYTVCNTNAAYLLYARLEGGGRLFFWAKWDGTSGDNVALGNCP